jgi:hypothetical protein
MHISRLASKKTNSWCALQIFDTGLLHLEVFVGVAVAGHIYSIMAQYGMVVPGGT